MSARHRAEPRCRDCGQPVGTPGDNCAHCDDIKTIARMIRAEDKETAT